MVEFKDRLRSLMEHFQLSQADIVRRTGWSKSMVSNYLLGKRFPKQDKIMQLHELFGVSISWLIGVECPMFEKEANYDYELLTEEGDFSIEVDKPKATVKQPIKKHVIEENEEISKTDKFFYVTTEYANLSDEDMDLVYNLVKRLRQ